MQFIPCVYLWEFSPDAFFSLERNNTVEYILKYQASIRVWCVKKQSQALCVSAASYKESLEAESVPENAYVRDVHHRLETNTWKS